MELPEQAELKWVSKHKLQDEEEEEEDVGLKARRSVNGHGQNGDSHDSFDGNGNGTSSTVTSPDSFSSKSKDGAESGFQFTDEDEGFGAVESHVEEHADAGEGEAELKNRNSVYFDRDQGLWKCHHCDWTYRTASPWTSEGYSLNLTTSTKTFVFETKGTDSANGFSEIKSNVVESFPIESTLGLKELDVTSKDFDIQKNPMYDMEHQVGEFKEVESFSDPSMLPVGKSHGEENTNVDNHNNNNGADEVGELIEEECDLDVPDLDVEGVIAKQETHKLMCPNCRCDITKTVILIRKKKIRFRKAKTHKPSREVRPQVDADPEHPAVEDDQGEGRVDSGSNDGPTPVADGNVQERETDVFRCLSCFTFFIPEGGFFWIFRGKNDTQTPRSPQHVPAPAVNTNEGTIVWNDETTAVERETDTAGKGSSSLTSVQPATPPAIKAPQDGKSETNVNQVTDMAMKYEILPDRNGLASYSQPVYRIVENDGAIGPQKVGTDISNSSVQEYTQPGIPQQVGMDISSSSVQEYRQPESVLPYAPDKLLDPVQQNKPESTSTMTVAARGSEPADDLIEEPLLQTETRIDVDEPVVTESSEPREWDILKSIVYGGLIELITSLGVVSSAVGAGAATLNIMVLGVANLIGGLFIIAHNLGELRNNSSEEVSAATAEPQGRYYELLGRRERFKLHAVVAILSFLIFGALPPIVYGFSFRVSNDRDYKLAVVGASSLLCIALLAIGKGHVQRPPKSYFKTVLYYLTIGVMASGASYLVGVLLDKLLKDLGLFESSSVTITNVPFEELRSDQQLRWASY